MTTLYEKRGRRYYPVRERDAWADSWPKGAHLVVVEPGVRSYRYSIDPDNSAVLAAAKQKENRLREVLQEAMAMRPKSRSLTARQRAAWEQFQAAMGDDRYCVEYESLNGVIDRLMDVLLEAEE